MKIYSTLVFLIFLGCQNIPGSNNELNSSESNISIPVFQLPNIENNYDDLVLIKMEGIWTFKGKPYSGFATKYFPDGSVKSKTGFYNGKKQGEKIEYYPDGHPRQITFYHQNLMHGEVKNWSGSKGHPKLAIRNFYMGKPHGEHRKWYKNGQVFKIMNYNMGKEEGMQQAFNENGSIYANYEARNGRSFGLKRSMLCYKLDDEKLIRYEDN